MADERYARHAALPDFDQAAVMVAVARLPLRDPDAALWAGMYLAAAGIGKLVVGDGNGREVVIEARPSWWPSSDGDSVALACWRGSIAATQWLAGVSILETIYAHARAAFPDECCGYVAGGAVIRCTNAQTSGDNPVAPERGADTGFVIAGTELLAFARSFDTDAPASLVYHSHTNGRAYFSSVDQAIATGPAYPVEHLVVGVTVDGVRECARFAWSDAARAYVEIARW